MKRKAVLNKISIIAVGTAFILFIGHTFFKKYFGVFMVPSIYIQIIALVVFVLSEILKIIFKKNN